MADGSEIGSIISSYQPNAKAGVWSFGVLMHGVLKYGDMS